jgi:hypothetical protein
VHVPEALVERVELELRARSAELDAAREPSSGCLEKHDELLAAAGHQPAHRRHLPRVPLALGDDLALEAVLLRLVGAEQHDAVQLLGGEDGTKLERQHALLRRRAQAHRGRRELCHVGPRLRRRLEGEVYPLGEGSELGVPRARVGIEQLAHVTPHELLALEDALGLPRLGADHAAVAVEHQDRLAHVVEELAQALVRLRQPLLAVDDRRPHALERPREPAELVLVRDLDRDPAIAPRQPPDRVEQGFDRLHDLAPGNDQEHQHRPERDQHAQPQHAITAGQVGGVLPRQRELDHGRAEALALGRRDRPPHDHAVDEDDGARARLRRRCAALLSVQRDWLGLARAPHDRARHVAVLLQVVELDVHRVLVVEVEGRPERGGEQIDHHLRRLPLGVHDRVVLARREVHEGERGGAADRDHDRERELGPDGDETVRPITERRAGQGTGGFDRAPWPLWWRELAGLGHTLPLSEYTGPRRSIGPPARPRRAAFVVQRASRR